MGASGLGAHVSSLNLTHVWVCPIHAKKSGYQGVGISAILSLMIRKGKWGNFCQRLIYITEQLGKTLHKFSTVLKG